MSRAVAAGLVTLMGCAAAPTEPDEDDTATCGAAGPATVITDDFEGGTEGLAFSPDGTLYVTSRSLLARIDPDGTVTEVAPVARTIGIAWWNGAVWATSAEDDDGNADPALVEVAPDGTRTRHPLDVLSSPNFLVPTPWGTLLVDEPGGDTIVEWSEGQTTVWAEGVPSPNGMVFSPDGSTLYVASTFRESGLHTVAVQDGQAGSIDKLVEFPGGAGADGVAMDADGRVLVALNILGRVDAVTPDGDVETVTDTVPYTASIAFGRGPWDPCALYSTSLFGPEIFEAPVGLRSIDDASAP